MIAGGTGITPMIQVIHKIFTNPEDKTNVSLIYSNKTEEDILEKDYLEALQLKYGKRFRVYHTLSK